MKSSWRKTSSRRGFQTVDFSLDVALLLDGILHPVGQLLGILLAHIILDRPLLGDEFRLEAAVPVGAGARQRDVGHQLLRAHPAGQVPRIFLDVVDTPFGRLDHPLPPADRRAQFHHAVAQIPVNADFLLPRLKLLVAEPVVEIGAQRAPAARAPPAWNRPGTPPAETPDALLGGVTTAPFGFEGPHVGTLEQIGVQGAARALQIDGGRICRGRAHLRSPTMRNSAGSSWRRKYSRSAARNCERVAGRDISST